MKGIKHVTFVYMVKLWANISSKFELDIHVFPLLSVVFSRTRRQVVLIEHSTKMFPQVQMSRQLRFVLLVSGMNSLINFYKQIDDNYLSN